MYTVVSKAKNFFKTKGLNTSATAITETNTHLEKLFGLAAEFAVKDGRKTVMERDIKAALEVL